ncbi:MAG: sulfurtransferase TusA family protein [Clostridiaceae bacterium]|jgi:tRNA 2-thiouridine synthesizing protein A|nr:sulfurtransferase TusA family protein [Clostridiaceae bacterium]
MKTVDTRGLSCPEPVLLVRKAIMEGEYPFVVLVDDATPYENIRRYATNNGHKFEVVEEDGEYKFTFTE